MTNYQLYRTNVLLGGQMKYDLILEPRYNGGQTIINDFHISPISKKVPYAKYVVDNLLNYPHIENIKKFYETTRSSFYKSYTDPILESDAFLPLGYNEETSETTYEMGCRRVSQRLYGKQFEFLCPVWIEQIDDINQLEFEFQVCVNDKQTKPLYIRRVSFNENEKLSQYFNNYIQDGVKLNTGIDWVFSINKDKCQVNGLDVQNGIYKTIELFDLWTTLSSRERPLLEFNNMIINKLNAYNLITPQLFNFNLCFNYEDILNPYLYSELHKHPIYINVVVRLNGDVLEMRDIFSNHEYLDKPYLHLPKLELTSNNQLEVITQTSGENLLNYLNDDKCYTLINKNKILQNTCHWRYSSGSNSHFNLYNGFSSIFKSQSGQIINVPYYNEEVCNIKYDGMNMDNSKDQTYILNYPYWCNNYDYDFGYNPSKMLVSIPELFLNDQYKHLWSTFYPGCIQKGVRYQNSDDQTDTHIDVLSFYTLPINDSKILQNIIDSRDSLFESYTKLTQYYDYNENESDDQQKLGLNKIKSLKTINKTIQSYVGSFKEFDSKRMDEFCDLILTCYIDYNDWTDATTPKNPKIEKYLDYSKEFLTYKDHLRDIGEDAKLFNLFNFVLGQINELTSFNFVDAMGNDDSAFNSNFRKFEEEVWDFVRDYDEWDYGVNELKSINDSAFNVLGTDMSTTDNFLKRWSIQSEYFDGTGTEHWIVRDLDPELHKSDRIHDLISAYSGEGDFTSDRFGYLSNACQYLHSISTLLNPIYLSDVAPFKDFDISSHENKLTYNITYLDQWDKARPRIGTSIQDIKNLQFDTYDKTTAETFAKKLNEISIPNLIPTSIETQTEFKNLLNRFQKLEEWLSYSTQIFDIPLYGEAYGGGANKQAIKEGEFQEHLLDSLLGIVRSRAKTVKGFLEDIHIMFDQSCRILNHLFYLHQEPKVLRDFGDIISYLYKANYVLSTPRSPLTIYGELVSPIQYKIEMLDRLSSFLSTGRITVGVPKSVIWDKINSIARKHGLPLNIGGGSFVWVQNIKHAKMKLKNILDAFMDDPTLWKTLDEYMVKWENTRTAYTSIFKDNIRRLEPIFGGYDYYGKIVLKLVYEYSQLIQTYKNNKFVDMTVEKRRELEYTKYKDKLIGTIFTMGDNIKSICSSQFDNLNTFKENTLYTIQYIGSNMNIEDIAKILDKIKADYNTIDYTIKGDDLLIVYRRDPVDNKINKILFWNIIESLDELYLPFKKEMLYKNFIETIKDVPICNDLLNILNKPTTDLQQSIVFLNSITPYKVNSPSLNTTEIDYYKHKFHTPTTIFRELGKIKPYFIEPTNMRYRNYQYSKVTLNDENIDSKYFATPYSPKYPSINYFPLKSEPVQYMAGDDKSKNEYHHYTSNKIINLCPEYDIEYRTKDETKFDIDDYVYQFLKGEYISILNDENISNEILTQRLNHIANQYKLEKSIIDTEVVDDDEIQMVYKIKIKLK